MWSFFYFLFDAHSNAWNLNEKTAKSLKKTLFCARGHSMLDAPLKLEMYQKLVKIIVLVQIACQSELDLPRLGSFKTKQISWFFKGFESISLDLPRLDAYKMLQKSWFLPASASISLELPRLDSYKMLQKSWFLQASESFSLELPRLDSYKMSQKP